MKHRSKTFCASALVMALSASPYALAGGRADPLATPGGKAGLINAPSGNGYGSSGARDTDVDARNGTGGAALRSPATTRPRSKTNGLNMGTNSGANSDVNGALNRSRRNNQ